MAHQFGQATFYMLNSYMWLVSTVVNSTDLDHEMILELS